MCMKFNIITNKNMSNFALLYIILWLIVAIENFSHSHSFFFHFYFILKAHHWFINRRLGLKWENVVINKSFYMIIWGWLSVHVHVHMNMTIASSISSMPNWFNLDCVMRRNFLWQFLRIIARCACSGNLSQRVKWNRQTSAHNATSWLLTWRFTLRLSRRCCANTHTILI